MGKGNKGTYKEIIKKRAEGAKGAKGDSESEGGTPAAPTKGCHITESYHIICRKPKVPAPALGADDGVKMLCTSKKCPFAESQYVHRECFEYATGKIIDALRTTTSRWANEHYTYNAWNQRGYDQLGRFECPCGKGSQTLDDSKFVYRKDGTCITMEQHRAEMVENAMKAVKPEKAKNAPGYKRAPAVSQWELEKKLDREFATEKSSTSHLEPVFERTPIPEEEAPPKDPTLEPGYMDGDGFVTVGKNNATHAEKERAPPAPKPLSKRAQKRAEKLQARTLGYYEGAPGISLIHESAAATPTRRAAPSAAHSVAPSTVPPSQGSARSRAVSISSNGTGLSDTWDSSSYGVRLTPSFTNLPPGEAAGSASNESVVNPFPTPAQSSPIVAATMGPPPTASSRTAKDTLFEAAANPYPNQARTGLRPPTTTTSATSIEPTPLARVNAASVWAGGVNKAATKRNGGGGATQGFAASNRFAIPGDDNLSSGPSSPAPDVKRLCYQAHPLRTWVVNDGDSFEDWTITHFKTINEAIRVQGCTFRDKSTGKTFRDPRIHEYLTARVAWLFTDMAMAAKAPEIPECTQLTLREYYAIFNDCDLQYPDDPVVIIGSGEMFAMECVEVLTDF